MDNKAGCGRGYAAGSAAAVLSLRGEASGGTLPLAWPTDINAP